MDKEITQLNYPAPIFDQFELLILFTVLAAVFLGVKFWIKKSKSADNLNPSLIQRVAYLGLTSKVAVHVLAHKDREYLVLTGADGQIQILEANSSNIKPSFYQVKQQLRAGAEERE